MAFQDFLGNRATVDFVRGMIEKDRVPHALLFAGPVGVGKYTLTQMLAKALHCEEAKSDFCGHCRNCRTIALADDRWAAVEQAEEDREKLSRRPREVPLLVQHHPDVLLLAPNGPLRLFQIEQGRYLKQALEYAPSTAGARKIFLLPDADRMDAAAANSLLKSLEEPPPHVLLLLTTARETALLPTIRSRCVTLRLVPVPANAVANFLKVRGIGADEKERLWRAAFSKGSPGQALRMDAERNRNLRDALLEMLDAATQKGNFSTVIAQAQKLAQQKEPLENLLDVLYSLFQDILHIEVRADGEPLRNIDRPKRLWQVSRRIGSAGLSRAGAQLRRLEMNLRRNIPVEISLEAFAASLALACRAS